MIPKVSRMKWTEWPSIFLQILPLVAPCWRLLLFLTLPSWLPTATGLSFSFNWAFNLSVTRDSVEAPKRECSCSCPSSFNERELALIDEEVDDLNGDGIVEKGLNSSDWSNLRSWKRKKKNKKGNGKVRRGRRDHHSWMNLPIASMIESGLGQDLRQR